MENEKESKDMSEPKVCKHWKPRGEPKSYIEWHKWAWVFSRKHKQKYCTKCKRVWWQKEAL